jgi:cytochrome P450
MESFRTHCFQLTATHRAAVSDFAFSDGYVVPAGQSVQFYQAGIHLDQERYKDAERFDPERFRGSVKSATDIGMEWPFWGAGKNSWYVLTFVFSFPSLDWTGSI